MIHKFYYEALNTRGEKQIGHVAAETEAGAIMTLRGTGVYPTKIALAGTKKDLLRNEKESIAPLDRHLNHKPKERVIFTPITAFFTGLTIGVIFAYISFIILYS